MNISCDDCIPRHVKVQSCVKSWIEAFEPEIKQESTVWSRRAKFKIKVFREQIVVCCFRKASVRALEQKYFKHSKRQFDGLLVPNIFFLFPHIKNKLEVHYFLKPKEAVDALKMHVFKKEFVENYLILFSNPKI